MHASPQFTPAQLIEAGRRAEAEGRLDLAAQFYGHLAENFAEAPEAAEARASLGRMAASRSRVRLWSGHPGAAHAMRSVGRIPYYRAGRSLAAVLSAFGWLLLSIGLAVVPIYLFIGTGAIGLPLFGLLPIAGGAAGLFIVGAAVALAGQIARAQFDQASAACELLALERARLGID